MEDFVTKDDINELKVAINNSLKEIIRMFLGHKDRLDAIEQRLKAFNSKSGQKI